MNNIKLLPSLLIFAEVARRQSFTAAAIHLKMSKSAVSQHISRLEDQLGSQLLSRNTRGMTITAIGEKLLLRSELLKDQVELAFNELASAEQTPSGIFSVTFPNILEKNVAIPALKQLTIEFPLIELKIIVTDQALDLINDNLDAAIFAGDLPDSNYRALPLGIQKEIIFATPNYIHKEGMPNKPEDLKKLKWITTNWQKSKNTFYCNKKSIPEQTIELKPFALCNSLPSALEMAKQDMGFVILPEFAACELIKTGQMVQILNNYHGKKWPFYLIHPFQGEKPIHVTRFYQLIKHYFSKA